MSDIRIREKASGDTFTGTMEAWNNLTPDVKAKYDLIGPAAAAPPANAPAPSGDEIMQQNLKSLGRQTTAFHELGALGRAATSPQMAQAAGAAVLPTAGAIAGTPLGPVGMAGGAALGEGANQALGITEPSVDSVLMNAAVPLAGQLLGRSVNTATKFVGSRLPGASSTLHEMAAEDLAKIPGLFRPKATADQLYSVVDQFNPRIDMPNLSSTATKLLSREDQAAAGLKLPSVAKTAESLGEAAQQGMAFQDARVNLRRLGDAIRASREAGGEEHGAYKAMFRAAMDDLDAAAAKGNPALPAVQALKAANVAAKREFAADELADLFSVKGGGISPRPDGAGVQVNFGRIMRNIQKNDDLKRTLSPQEYDKLVSDVREMWSNTPNLPAVAGQDAGSKIRNKSIAIGAGTGGAASYAFGFNPLVGTSIGGAAGAILPDTIGKLMVSDGGRQFLRGILQGSGGVISPATLGVLATAVGNTPPSRDKAVQLTEMGRQYLMNPQGSE